ncbi:MAG: T9SS type A sorting domain-containing protein [Bacteroidales bacterium]
MSSPVPIEWGLYEYIVTAIYYFGESGPSNAVVITGSAEHSVQGITIYPNPASDKVLIQTEMIINKVELYDHLGRCVSSIDKSVDFHKINVSGFDSGLYFLKIETSETSMLQKLIIHDCC